MTEALQDGLDRLKQRSEDLKAAIVAKKREAAQLQKKRSQALEQQLRRVRSRLSSQQRKLRTRRLFVLGGLMEKECPPDAAEDDKAASPSNPIQTRDVTAMEPSDRPSAWERLRGPGSDWGVLGRMPKVEKSQPTRPSSRI